MTDLNELYEGVLGGNLEKSVEVTQSAIDENISAKKIMEFMVKAMDEIGDRFEKNIVFVPNLLMAARAMKGCLELIRPLLIDSGAESKGKVAIATVKGDLHDIGKNIVASMLEGSGFEILNLGVDIGAEKFVECVKNEKPDIIALSALLTTTMPNMKTIINALEEEGIRDQVKVMVGGPAVTQEFTDSIGADGWSTNGNAAVRLAKELVA